MSNEILYILLPYFAAHEMVYLMETVSSDETQLKAAPKYINKVVAPIESGKLTAEQKKQLIERLTLTASEITYN